MMRSLLLVSLLTLAACAQQPTTTERPELDLDEIPQNDGFSPLRPAEIAAEGGSLICQTVGDGNISRCAPKDAPDQVVEENVPERAASILDLVRSGDTIIQE